MWTNYLCPYRESNSGHKVRNLVLYPLNHRGVEYINPSQFINIYLINDRKRSCTILFLKSGNVWKKSFICPLLNSKTLCA